MKTMLFWHTSEVKCSVNMQEFNYVLCIAKHQNLTKAAQELYISQPTLSKFLQKLEREMDGKLFNRIGNRFVPTHLGRRYMEYARRMLEVNQDWERELLDLNACQEGELNIAFPLMRSSCMVPHILPIFHATYPGIRVNLREETYAIQERLLLDDELDFAVFNEGHPHPRLEYEKLQKEEILLLLPPHHPLASKAVERDGFAHPWMDLKLFAEEPFILHFPEQTTGHIARQLFEFYEIDPPVPFYTRNTQACAMLCQQGMGASFVPEGYLRGMHFHEPPLCFSVGEKGTFSQLTIAYRKGAYLPSYAREFIRIAKENV